VNYQIIRSRRRTLELRVYPDRRVEVRAPLRMAQTEIQSFVDQRQDWLTKRLATFADAPSVLPPSQRFACGSEHPYLGRRIRLILRKGRGRASFDGDALTLSVVDVSRAEVVEKALLRWYRLEAQREFNQRLLQWFEHFSKRGHKMPALQIRAMRSRWGSLSLRSGMTLNLELIKTPPECIDYVVLHELCHLEHMNHGPHFKALMSEYMADWPARKQQLNRVPLR
jgi:predicted metal-dependent hydrolase